LQTLKNQKYEIGYIRAVTKNSQVETLFLISLSMEKAGKPVDTGK